MAEKLKLPTEVVDSDWKDDIDFQLIGGSEHGEANYKNMTLIKKSEVKNSTTNYKDRKIGRVALFSLRDKLVA